jgi:hypothetical protein
MMLLLWNANCWRKFAISQQRRRQLLRCMSPLLADFVAKVGDNRS